jgi:hypothetical protein
VSASSIRPLETIPADVGHRLAAAGVAGTPEWVRPLSFGKTAVRLGGGAGFVKLSCGPFAVELARREAAAYAEPPPRPPFARPELLGFHDGGDWATLWLSSIDGTPESAWRALLPCRGPFDGADVTIRPLSAVLEVMVPATNPSSPVASLRRLLVEREGDRAIACERAHGDFLYWNVLRRRGAPPTLIDFEHSLSIAPRGHDRLYWTAVPLLRRAAAMGGAEAAGRAMGLLLRLTVGPHLAATFLLHLRARLEREQTATCRPEDARAHETQWRARQLELIGHLLRETLR